MVINTGPRDQYHHSQHSQEPLVTQEQRPFLSLAPKPDGVRQRADGRCVSWERTLATRINARIIRFAPTSDEASSEVNTLQIVFLGIHIPVGGSDHAALTLGRKHPKPIE